MKAINTGLAMALAAGLSFGLGSSPARAQNAEADTDAVAPVGAVITPAAIASLATKAPPAKTSATRTAGSGALQLNVANNAKDDDSMWVEKVDVDGDGGVEDTALVNDNEDKITFASSNDKFKCLDGSTGKGDQVIAVNGEGNARGRPAGSGFWAVSLDKGECGAKEAGIFGCRFDASGNSTECGAVTIDDANDDIVIADPAG
jgi:hypothetical protein